MAQGKEYTLKSGARLLVGAAPYPDARAARDAMLRALRGADVGKLVGLSKLDVDAAAQHPEEVTSAILNIVLAAGSAPDVEAALMKCGARALYGAKGLPVEEGFPVDEELFDRWDGAARPDFYPVMLKLLEVHVLPFFAAAFSGSKAASPTAPAAPSST